MADCRCDAPTGASILGGRSVKRGRHGGVGRDCDSSTRSHEDIVTMMSGWHALLFVCSFVQVVITGRRPSVRAVARFSCISFNYICYRRYHSIRHMYWCIFRHFIHLINLPSLVFWASHGTLTPTLPFKFQSLDLILLTHRASPTSRSISPFAGIARVHHWIQGTCPAGHSLGTLDIKPERFVNHPHISDPIGET
jgi:hypothetical protein